MKTRFCYRVAVMMLALCCSVVGVFGQTKKTDDQDVTPAERKEIQALAKRFVKRYQQARDLKPLIPEFFIDDFDSCIHEDLVRNLDVPKKIKLSPADARRMYIALFNLVYVRLVVLTYNPGSMKGDEDSLASVFPRRLAKDLNSSGALDEVNADRNAYLKVLRKAEGALSEARRYMRRKNIERSPKYLKQFKEYETSDWLGYIVKRNTDDDFNRCQSVKARFPSGTRFFSVTTPIWLVPIVVKERNRFKISFLTFYDE